MADNIGNSVVVRDFKVKNKCKKCKTCIGKFGCPAIYFEEDESIHIDINQCNGCGNCATVCPFDAIYEKEN